MSAVTSASGGQAAKTEDTVRQLRLRVLNDIADGKVFQLPNKVLEVDSRTNVGKHETAAYVAEVRRLLKASWVMESRALISRHNKPGGGVPLRLTTLGEVGLDGLVHDREVTR